jgi:hypothetical protein
MRHSEQIDQIAKALSAAQKSIRGAKKDSNNPHYKSRYADLASVWDACRDALTAQGLAVVQSAGSVDGQLRVSTMLVHTSGQWFADDLLVPVRDTGPQAVGSAITYGRRYSLAAFVGVAPEDDDAESAEARSKPVEDAPVKPKTYDQWVAGAKAIAEEQGVDALQTYFKAGSADLRKWATGHDREQWTILKVTAQHADDRGVTA